MAIISVTYRFEPCRLPPGRRGLKYDAANHTISELESPPTREAWIEITTDSRGNTETKSRLPPGRRGLKSFYMSCNHVNESVASHPGGVD